MSSSHPSPLRYPGGKTFLSSFLSQTISINGLEGGVYIEPFAGGGGAALRLLFDELVTQIHLNDIDPRIYSFWKSILTEPDAFIKLLEQTPIDVSTWKKQKDVLRFPADRSKLETGFATFYLNRTNRSGVLNAGPIGGMDQSGNYLIDARFNKKELIKKIEKISLYRDRISVSKRDAVDLLEEVIKVQKWKLDETFVYLDPPYHDKGKLLYSKFFRDEQHQRLAKFLNRCTHFKWIISYDDASVIHRLYEGKKNLYLMNYSVHQVRVGRELIIGSPDCLLPDGHFQTSEPTPVSKSFRVAPAKMSVRSVKK